MTISDLGSERRYGVLAMALHWVIAALILIQIMLGWWMNEWVTDHSAIQDQIQDVHISLGLTTLLLILVRIGVRLAYRPPPLPAGIPTWERWLAHVGHLLFYVLMLAMPLTGWALVSARHEDTPFWGLNWPYMPGMDAWAGLDHRPFRSILQAVHTQWLVWIALANLALHVAGALKHQFDGRPVLWRMLPFLKRGGTQI